MGSSLTQSVDPGDLVHVSTSTVTGGSATSIDITGLDLDAHHHYLILFELINADANPIIIEMFFNGDSTSTNYYTQMIRADGAGVSAARNNDGRMINIGNVSGGKKCMGHIHVRQVGDRVFAISTLTVDVGSSIEYRSYTTSWNRAAANITQITFTSQTATSIGNQSIMSVYRTDV